MQLREYYDHFWTYHSPTNVIPFVDTNHFKVRRKERAVDELGLTEIAVMVTLNKGAKQIDVAYDFAKDKYMIICERQFIKIPVIIGYNNQDRKIAMLPTLLLFNMNTDEDFNYAQPLPIIAEGVEVPEFEPIYV